jgi:hypothetical protein
MNDQDFIKKFEDGSFAKKDWSHTNHVRMAYIYLQNNSLELGTEKIRKGLIYLIKTQWVEEDQFHETLTTGWARLIDTMIRKGPRSQNFEEFAKLNPQLLDRHSIYFFYSPELMASKEARAKFIAPDRTDFPLSNYEFEDIKI